MTNEFSELHTNPFAVKTPENLSAKDLIELFVPYPEFENLQVSGHQFLNGHRGSGKSMMLRMMSPDSQMLLHGKKLHELNYFGVYLSIKATELNAPEFIRLEQEPGGTILSEHVLSTKLLSALFVSIKAHCSPCLSDANKWEKFKNVIVKSFFEKLIYAGWDQKLPDGSSDEVSTPEKLFDFLVSLADQIQFQSVQYIKRRSFINEPVPYQGALLGFQDTLLPTVKMFFETGLIPSPVYFLLDDADNLSTQQKRILNTWVSYRATDTISLKISTQLNYRIYETTSAIRIEAPHDFSSINFTSVYTGPDKDQYPKLVEEIVRKRLTKYGLKESNPYKFFPEDTEQEAAIKVIAQEYKDRWKDNQGGGYRANDDAYRNARPEYIRRLAGSSKQGSRYKYAGFEQLVHVSSGIIRFFLEPAQRMFTEQLQRNEGKPVTEISPAVQHEELKKQADELLLGGFDALVDEAIQSPAHPTHLRDIERLRNIVQGIGALFKEHVLDEHASQRRIFSFYVTGGPSNEIRRILELGIVHGYFYKASIGSKSGLGRETLYVLTRRLAPAFMLDPVGFSAYLTVTNKFLADISERPQTFVSRLRSKGLAKAMAELNEESPQLSLLEGGQNG